MLVLTACHTPRQAVAPVWEVSPKTEITFEHSIEIPEKIEEKVIKLPGLNFDDIFVELESSWVKIEQLKSEKDSLAILKFEVGRKPVYITDTVRIEFETKTLRYPGVDSVFTVINGKEDFIHSYKNNWKVKTLVAELREAKKGDRFPFEAVLVATVSLLFYFLKKKNNNVEDAPKS
ncbi:MAG: hypothetical protein AAFZ15_17380 [Bacteroidota bacterium]